MLKIIIFQDEIFLTDEMSKSHEKFIFSSLEIKIKVSFKRNVLILKLKIVIFLTPTIQIRYLNPDRLETNLNSHHKDPQWIRQAWQMMEWPGPLQSRALTCWHLGHHILQQTKNQLARCCPQVGWQSKIKKNKLPNHSYTMINSSRIVTKSTV